MPNAAHALNNIIKLYCMNITDDNDNDSFITPAEKAMLDEAMHTDPLSQDEINLKHSSLDNTDEDGDTLNEMSVADDVTGEELDIPGAEEMMKMKLLERKMKRTMVTARQVQNRKRFNEY